MFYHPSFGMTTAQATRDIFAWRSPFVFLLTEALQTFYTQSKGRLPSTVIVFRDGVGDGQLDMCLEQEIPQFQKGFEVAAGHVPGWK